MLLIYRYIYICMYICIHYRSFCFERYFSFPSLSLSWLFPYFLLALMMTGQFEVQALITLET